MTLTAHAISQPVVLYRALAGAPDERATPWRRVLLLALVLGCTVSALASGRLSIRLMLDGVVSFAFVPVVEVAAFTVVFWRVRPLVRYARALDLFLIANAPWLVWCVGQMALGYLFWPNPTLIPQTDGAWATAIVLLVPTLAWSAYMDFAFFRTVLGTASRAAVGYLLLFRVIAWTTALLYFVGIALWPDVVTWITR